MSPNDLEYYRRRVTSERALAKASERANISAIHEELARQYEALIEYAKLRSPLDKVVPIRQVA